MKEQLTKKVEIKNDQNGGCESKDTNHVMMVIIEKMAVHIRLCINMNLCSDLNQTWSSIPNQKFFL